MPEVNRANTYSPEQMDCEWFPWDCDNVSGEAQEAMKKKMRGRYQLT